MKGTPLSELKLGQRGTILSIHPESTVLLEHLAGLGLKPGRRIEMVEAAPFNGPIPLQLAEQMSVVRREVASYILIEPFHIDREGVLAREEFGMSENHTSKEG